MCLLRWQLLSTCVFTEWHCECERMSFKFSNWPHSNKATGPECVCVCCNAKWHHSALRFTALLGCWTRALKLATQVVESIGAWLSKCDFRLCGYEWTLLPPSVCARLRVLRVDSVWDRCRHPGLPLTPGFWFCFWHYRTVSTVSPRSPLALLNVTHRTVCFEQMSYSCPKERATKK